MSNPDDIAYTVVLETLVASLALKLGADPNELVPNVLREVAEAEGMESLETDRLIEQRWTGRQMPLAAQSALLPQVNAAATWANSGKRGLRSPETAEKPDLRARLADYKQRLSEAVSEGDPI